MADLVLNTQQLYAVALLAVIRERRAETDLATEFAIPIQCEAWATVASSPQEAVSLGVKRASELWPTSEGWFGHTARVLEIKLERDLPTVAPFVAQERIM